MLIGISAIFPCEDIEKTCDFYENKLGFRAAKYLGVAEPHICLYRDAIEIILTKITKNTFSANHVLYGYGADLYVYTKDQEALAEEFKGRDVCFVAPLHVTDYNNKEFTIEDCDGRHITFGCKVD